MLNVDGFLEQFPEFEGTIEDESLARLIDQVSIITNNYAGLPVDRQDYAVALRVAYEIEAMQPLDQFMKGNVKRIKSLNDEIEYAVNPIDPADYSINKYGARLKSLLRTSYYGGFSV